MRKHGVKYFTICPLVERIESWKEANRLEIFWIKKLRSNDREIGYNLSEGGEGIRDVTGEVAKKLSAATKRYLDGKPENNPAFRHDVSTEEVVSMRVRGDQVKDIAKHFGVSDACIYRRLNKEGIPLTRNTKNQDEEVVRLYAVEKYTTPEISSLLKISTGKAHTALKREGIPLRPPGSRPRLALKTEKNCPGCGETKPTSEYHNNSRNLDGYGTRCKECDNRASAKYKVEIKARKKTAEESYLETAETRGPSDVLLASCLSSLYLDTSSGF